MSHPRPPGRKGPSPTVRLQDVIDITEEPISDRESSYYAPRTGDWFLLGLLVVVLLGNGLFVWHQVGSNQHLGRAVFFGLLLLCILWAAVVYTFKLSVGVRVGPHGVSIVRGPWRTELPWREVARLVERVQVVNGQRYRWVVVLARDERRLQVREDMVADYQRFRTDVYRRYRLWRDRGGTWGATGGGPFTEREMTSSQVVWWSIAAATAGLPGLYFAILLPEAGLLGAALLAVAAVCGVMSLRAFTRRYTYTVDAKAIEARSLLQKVRLPWRDVTRAERSRLPFGGLIKLAVRVGRFVLWLADRSDARLRTSGWSPRVPEYLTLRGTGHQVRIALHRVGRPDELLAWVEFYERLGRRATAGEQARRTAAPVTKPALPELPAPDLSNPSGPPDPWGGTRDGAFEPADVFDGTDSSENAPSSEFVTALEMQETANVPSLERSSRARAAEASPPPDPWQQEEQAFPWQQEEQAFPWQQEGYPHAARGATSHAAPLPWERQEARQPATPPAAPFTPVSPMAADAPLGQGQPTEIPGSSWLNLGPTEAPDSQGFDDPSTPWRHDANWQPPQLPRFGPPSAPRQPSDQQDSDQFSRDDFLR